MMNNKIQNKYVTREKLKRQVKKNRGWYFIAFLSELPASRPYCFTLFNEPYVLFRDMNQQLICYQLYSRDDRQEEDSPKVQSFEVMQKQGEIWFYKG